MSPSWQTQPSSTSEAAGSGTPSSTTAVQSQTTGRSESGHDAGETPSNQKDGEGDTDMADAEHRRSDHERIDEATQEPVPPAPVLYMVDTERKYIRPWSFPFDPC